jgi:peptidoglycan/LPS O-acetylase OafA/YrhL
MLINAWFMLKLGAGALVWFVCLYMAVGTPAFPIVLFGGPVLGVAVLVLACIDQVREPKRRTEEVSEPQFKDGPLPPPHDWSGSQGPLKFTRR